MLLFFMTARTRKFAKQSYSHQVVKRRAFVLLFLYDRLYEKICEAKLLAPSYKKDVLNLFFLYWKKAK